MHEVMLACALIDRISDHAKRVGAVRVSVISLRMGTLAGIESALRFCFPSAAKGTLCERAELNIEMVPLTVRCPKGDATKTPAALYTFRYPDCCSATPDVLTGRELKLVSVGFVPPDAETARHRPGPLPTRPLNS
jgi:hydrogenase nickel incorporation protein HypA/HybF